MMPGKKDRRLHAVELSRLDEIIWSHGNVECVVIGVEVPEGDAERTVFVFVPALHKGRERTIAGRSRL